MGPSVINWYTKTKNPLKNSTGSLTSKVKVSVHEWHKDQNKMYILENKSETVIREADIKMRSPLTITADDSQKHCMLFYSTHQVYLIGVIFFSIYYILKTDIIFLLIRCTMYFKKTSIALLQTHSLSTIIWNYVSTYIFSTYMYQNNRSVKLRKMSLKYEES